MTTATATPKATTTKANHPKPATTGELTTGDKRKLSRIVNEIVSFEGTRNELFLKICAKVKEIHKVFFERENESGFKEWVDRNDKLPFGASTAYNYKRVHETFAEDKSGADFALRFDKTALIELAHRDGDDARDRAREKAIKMVMEDDKVRITSARAKELIEAARPKPQQSQEGSQQQSERAEPDPYPFKYGPFESESKLAKVVIEVAPDCPDPYNELCDIIDQLKDKLAADYAAWLAGNGDEPMRKAA